MEFELFFNDLNDEARERFIKALEENNIDINNMNLDSFSLAVCLLGM